MNETFNAEAAKRAVENARAEIEELIRNFEQARSNISENFAGDAASTSAMGGSLGDQAQRTFEENSSVKFDKLKENMSNFIDNRVEAIIASNVNMEEEARSTYSGM